jgi:steroid delta-isomerase-like uncharacterized protein
VELTMKGLELAHAYFSAWNARDADAVVATFGDSGTYTDPTTNGPLSGTAIGAYAKRLWDAFPDLSFEIRSVAETVANKVVAEWTMNGTNTGAFAGLPATGRPVSVPGLDVVVTGPGGIASVTGYFDSRVVPEQLGLQVLVQPRSIGPFSFGNSVAVQSGKKTKPGAFSITAIWNEAEQDADVRALSQATAQDMLKMKGFIGLALLRVGGRGITISAWEKPEDAKQVLTSGAHREAMARFWKDLGDAAFTSVWTPDHINPLWVRCPACRKMNDYEKNAGQCACGRALSEAPAYF